MPSSDTSPVVTKSQGGIQSLEIGLSILDILIAHNDSMMLKDIAQVMQIHPAKAHRYLVSLIRKGYACQLDDGRYGLGERITALGYTTLNQHNILARLTQLANDIKETLNCGVQIAKWFPEGPIIIQSVEPDSPISIITRIGSRMPLTTSATGQLFASYQPEDIIKPLLMAEWQDKTNSTKKWQAFNQLKTLIRTQGYATVSGDMLAGVNAITIPVFLPQLSTFNHVAGKPDLSVSDTLAIEYAITVIGTSEQLPMDKQDDTVSIIVALAKQHQML